MVCDFLKQGVASHVGCIFNCDTDILQKTSAVTRHGIKKFRLFINSKGVANGIRRKTIQ